MYFYYCMPSRITFYEVKLDFKETITKWQMILIRGKRRPRCSLSLSTEDPSFQPQAKNIFFPLEGKGQLETANKPGSDFTHNYSSIFTSDTMGVKA